MYVIPVWTFHIRLHPEICAICVRDYLHETAAAAITRPTTTTIPLLLLLLLTPQPPPPPIIIIIIIIIKSHIGHCTHTSESANVKVQ
jgi:hypothetical protein